MNINEALDEFLLDNQEKRYVHLRLQHNGRRKITLIQGLNEDFDFKKIIKYIKKASSCGGTILEDEEYGKVLEFQGDQRSSIFDFLNKELKIEKELIKIHGY